MGSFVAKGLLALVVFVRSERNEVRTTMTSSTRQYPQNDPRARLVLGCYFLDKLQDICLRLYYWVKLHGLVKFFIQ